MGFWDHFSTLKTFSCDVQMVLDRSESVLGSQNTHPMDDITRFGTNFSTKNWAINSHHEMHVCRLDGYKRVKNMDLMYQDVDFTVRQYATQEHVRSVLNTSGHYLKLLGADCWYRPSFWKKFSFFVSYGLQPIKIHANYLWNGLMHLMMRING